MSKTPKSAAAKPTIAMPQVDVPQIASQPGMTRLTWNHWPDHEIPLLVDDLAGEWSFVQSFGCGDFDGVLVVAFAERQSRTATRRMVDIKRVWAPEAGPFHRAAYGIVLNDDDSTDGRQTLARRG